MEQVEFPQKFHVVVFSFCQFVFDYPDTSFGRDITRDEAEEMMQNVEE